MKKFRFRLQKVMEFKQQKQKENEKKLAAVKEKLRQQQNKLAETNNHKNRCEEEIRERSSSHVDVPELQLYYSYLSRLAQEIVQQMEQIWKLEKDAEDKRNLLVKSLQEKKILERLREKSYLSYRREVDKWEQKQLDEVATSLTINNNLSLREGE